MGPHMPLSCNMETLGIPRGRGTDHESTHGGESRRFALEAWSSLGIVCAPILHSGREAYQLLEILGMKRVSPVLHEAYREAQAWEQLSLRLGCCPVAAGPDAGESV